MKAKTKGSVNILSFLAYTSLALGLIVTIYFAFKMSDYYQLSDKENKIDLNTTGTVGDFIGGIVGPLWSLAGVLFFVKALRLQREDLELQRTELKETREVFEQQKFDSLFFNMMKTRQEIRISFNKNNTNSKTYFDSKSEYLKVEYLSLIDKVKPTDRSVRFPPKNFDFEKLDEPNYFLQFFVKKERNQFEKLSYYFRHLYHLLKLIDDTKEDELRFYDSNEYSNTIKVIKYKYRRYADLVQAECSQSELILIFYNALYFPKTKRLLHTFNFLENLDTELLLEKEHIKYYQNWVYKGEKLPDIKFKNSREFYDEFDF